MKNIKTTRLRLTLAGTSDLPDLEEIEKECDEYFTFDPPCAAEHNRPIWECLAIGDKIPGIKDEEYKKENYHLYCVWQGDTLIGFLSYYLEYKKKDAVYLSVLYIKEAYRKMASALKFLRHWKINCSPPNSKQCSCTAHCETQWHCAFGLKTDLTMRWRWSATAIFSPKILAV